ncbi:PH domain-containing protein [Halegenticoccus tardaugens]|uniref:PH domain-containing protein n=1 Tax=Halegenticoccus tardaugens TaxID=2071624 RepID=UPI00100C19D2|nr:PH domain-containing protein [Halegenticoccus tardaugens]
MNRLHPRIRALWVVRAVALAVVLGLAVGAVNEFTVRAPRWVPGAVFLVALVAGVALALARYRLWGYEVREDSLYLERGVFTRVRTVVPFVRIQHVDATRGPVERLVGLAHTVVYTAGSRGADVAIPGLTPEGSDDLQERLKRLAIRAEGEDAV